jgi:homospermidine synthase
LLDALPVRAPSGLDARYEVTTLSRLLLPDAAMLDPLLDASGASSMLDFADLDTREIAAACAARGVSYLNTSYGVWPAEYRARGARARIMLRAREIRSELARWSVPPGVNLILGSGMNPGVINAIVVEAVRRIARGAALHPSEIERSLRRIVLTESDTTRVGACFEPNEFPATWNPTHVYEELTEIQTGYVRAGETCWLAQRPVDTRVTAWAAGRRFVGMLVPHEEVVTLGERYPSAEIGFVYAIPDQTQRRLARIAAREHLQPVLLAPPRFASLAGEDTVGVLLDVGEHGTYWFGFENAHEEALPYGTSATLLQVAAGAAAGLGALLAANDRWPGVRVVEDLDTAAYLTRVERVLGPMRCERVSDFEFAGFACGERAPLERERVTAREVPRSEGRVAQNEAVDRGPAE